MLNRNRPLPFWRQEIERASHRRERRHSYYNIGTIALAGGSVALAGKSLFNTMRGAKSHAKSSSSSSSSFDIVTPLRQEENIVAPVHTIGVTTSYSKEGDKKNVKQVVKSRGHFKKHDGLQHLLRMIMPTYNIRVRSYGTCVNGSSAGASADGPVQQYGTGAIQNGQFRSAVSVAGSQYFGQIMHLTGGSANVGGYKVPATTNICPATGLTYSAIEAYGRDAFPLSQLVNNSDPFTNLNVSRQFRNAIEYLGGRTTHHFMNTGNSDCYFEYWMCHPKTFLSFKMDPMSLLILSKQTQKPQQNGREGLYYPIVSIPSSQSKLFSVSNRDIMLHESWNVSHGKSVVINPGCTFTLEVPHTGFCFEQSAFNYSLIGGIGGDDNNTYYPFCTAVMMFRIHGSMGTNDTGLTGGNTITALNWGPSQVAHWQEESHAVKPSVYSAPNSTYYQDFTTDGGTFNVVNPETDLEMQCAI